MLCFLGGFFAILNSKRNVEKHYLCPTKEGALADKNKGEIHLVARVDLSCPLFSPPAIDSAIACDEGKISIVQEVLEVSKNFNSG